MLVEAEADVNECILSMCSHLDSHGFSFNDDARALKPKKLSTSVTILKLMSGEPET